MRRECEIVDITEALRQFFQDSYRKTIGKSLEELKGKPFADIPLMEKPLLGLIVGGYSAAAFLSEVWEVLIPNNALPNEARQIYGPGKFGVSWHATSTPIQRYFKGIDFSMMTELQAYVVQILGRVLTQDEQAKINEIRDRYQYKYVYNSMPVQSGKDCVRFLVDLVINHFRFVEGTVIVGGKPKLGVVTYKGESFQLVD